MRPLAMREEASTVAPASKWASRSETLTMLKRVRKALLLKPRLGRRRKRGIFPPSEPKWILPPARAPEPLVPRVEDLPCPEDSPRPTRLRFLWAPTWTVI